MIARTDAWAVHGLDDAIARGQGVPGAAGADMIFLEAPRMGDELRRVAQEGDAPLVADMVEGSKTPLLPASELEAMGYKLVIHASTLLRIEAQAVKDALAVLDREGWAQSLVDRMVTFDERQRTVGLPEYEELERRYREY